MLFLKESMKKRILKKNIELDIQLKISSASEVKQN